MGSRDRERIVKSKKQKGITRQGTPLDEQIEWTAANEKFVMEEYLEGRYWDPITKGIAQTPEKIEAIEVKINKMVKMYRFEEILFDKIKDRINQPLLKREAKLIKTAYESPYLKERYGEPWEYMSRVFGRPVKQLKKLVNKIYNSSTFGIFRRGVK